MRKRRKLVCCVMVLLMIMSIVSSPYAVAESKLESVEQVEFAEDTIVVMFNSETSLRLESKDVGDFSEVEIKSVRDLSEGTTERTAERIAKIVREAKVSSKLNNTEFEEDKDKKDEIIENYRLIVCLELENPGKDNVLKAIEELRKRKDIEYVGPDYCYTTCSTSPNDTYLSNQWGITMIDAREAWDITTGSNSIRVGVMDTGIDGSHQDLKNRISNSLNRSFINGSNTLETVPTDPIGHGTHVAGIIGAQGNNALGITGVCWNVELISLKVFTDNILQTGGQGGLSSWFIAAIDFAIVNDIDVLNFSGSGTAYDQAFYNKIDSFSGLFVCAAGQREGSGCNLDGTSSANRRYPACYDLDNIIAVGAIKQANSTNIGTNLYSNYGAESVDLFAPGANIYSTLPGNTYGYQTGTSMATPFVTGTIALLMAEYPNLTSGEIKRTILDTTTLVFSPEGNNPLEGKAVTEGVLNAYNALRYISHRGGSCTSTSSLYSHNVFCLDCGAIFQEAHTWRLVNNMYRCTKCLMQTTTIPEIH